MNIFCRRLKNADRDLDDEDDNKRNVADMEHRITARSKRTGSTTTTFSSRRVRHVSDRDAYHLDV